MLHITSAYDEDVALCGAAADDENAVDHRSGDAATCAECVEIREEQRFNEAHP